MTSLFPHCFLMQSPICKLFLLNHVWTKFFGLESKLYRYTFHYSLGSTLKLSNCQSDCSFFCMHVATRVSQYCKNRLAVTMINFIADNLKGQWICLPKRGITKLGPDYLEVHLVAITCSMKYFIVLSYHLHGLS